jgi:hypothetical protein
MFQGKLTRKSSMRLRVVGGGIFYAHIVFAQILTQIVRLCFFNYTFQNWLVGFTQELMEMYSDNQRKCIIIVYTLEAILFRKVYQLLIQKVT